MANKPNIRFKGFTEDWEQRKLGEICSRVQGNDGRMELPTLTISAANGWMKQEDRFSGNIAGKEQKNYTLLHKGELSYNHGNSKLAKYGTVFSLQTYEEALVPRVYHSFKVEIGSADFIEYYFATKMPDRELRKLISSGARMDGLLNIGYDDFMGIKMMFPSVLEQDKIAEYFRAFDHLITLHQRKCDDTKKLKKYMLQKMFPKNGEKKPEIRFAGFTDDWEQRKVTELLKNSSSAMKIGPFGSALKKEYFVEKGIKVYAQENAFTGDFSMGDYYITEDKYKELKSCELYPGDLVISMMGTIGVCAIFPENAEKGIMNSHLLRLQFNNEVIPEYIMYLLRDSALIRKQIERLSVGSIMSGLSSSVVKKLVFPIPKLVEQKRIVEYFSNLDHLITLHQRKCDDLKNLKKYMLQNMFV